MTTEKKCVIRPFRHQFFCHTHAHSLSFFAALDAWASLFSFQTLGLAHPPLPPPLSTAVSKSTLSRRTTRTFSARLLATMGKATKDKRVRCLRISSQLLLLVL
jgi:hypothetical protein